MTMNSPITAVMNGAGLRGREVYGAYALQHPDKIRFIAIAEPNEARRKEFQQEHGIPDEFAFNSWEELLHPNTGKIADVAFICTQDRMHYQPTLQALDIGYDILLEKPISPSIQECRHIEQKALETGRYIQISHVLRYTPFWQKIKEIVQSGVIGSIIDYDHSENVSYWHFGHSYVRGLYQSVANSSPMILAKSCHDLDLIYWILGEQPISVQSMGYLSNYVPENAPLNTPDFCSDGCKDAESCPWYAPRLYLDGEPVIRAALNAPSRFSRLFAQLALKKSPLLHLLRPISPRIGIIFNWNQWPSTALTTDLTPEGKKKALVHSPYDRCIFKCDNDVMDHQIATFTFPNKMTATLRVHGLSDLEGREIRIFGTKGSIRGVFRFNEEKIIVRTFRSSHPQIFHQKGLHFDFHGGGDFGLMDNFVDLLQHPEKRKNQHTSDIVGAMESHYMAFAAEEARKTQKSELMSEYRNK